MKSLLEIRAVILSAILLFSAIGLHAQTTGKIAGYVVDANSGEPLAGASILIEDTNLGAEADLEGSFFIINVPPGDYTVSAMMIGYQTVIVKELRVSVNRTSTVEFSLSEALMETEEIVVTADKIATKKDQTSSIRNISSEDMDLLPVESINGVVAMQPGVVQGHFRGGRSNEVSYMIDGLQVDQAFSRSGKTIEVEKDVVEEVEVITGTFNAEYGKAMSGIVNAITKDGADRFSGKVSVNYGDFATTHDDQYMGLYDTDFLRQKDYRLFLTGPVWKNHIGFVANMRYQDNIGHLYGIRRFNVNDYSDFVSQDSSEWYSEHNGNDKLVPMQWNKNLTFFGKLTYAPFRTVKTSVTYTLNDSRGQGYSHSMKYNPDGRSTGYGRSHMVAFQLNQTLSRSAFYEFRASYVRDWGASYLYENPTDPRYVHDLYSGKGTAGFSTGGQSKGWSENVFEDINAKFDFTWQINRHHSIKTGMLYTGHHVDLFNSWVRNRYDRTGVENDSMHVIDANGNRKVVFLYYEPELAPDTTSGVVNYEKYPYEFSGYLQDKMEFEDLVINLGIRYDYFNPNTRYPSQLRNPGNQLLFYLKDEGGNIIYNQDGNPILDPVRMSGYEQTDPKLQISPRIGVSYQLGEKAVLRFAYGHFFQMPPLSAMYTNHRFVVPPTDYATTMGNPNIEAQKTIQYEVGLWMQLMRGMNLEVAVYYRDIYDLQSAKVITTFNQIEYGLFSNKDYGNVRGLELKYEFFYRHLTAFLNYTLQYTRGNADTPTSTFTRAGNKTDPVNRLIPMSWDQRHTLNLSLGYNLPGYGATLTAYYNSGTPYSWSPLPESPLSRVNLFPNNSHKPSTFHMDLTGYYDLMEFGGFKTRLNILVYHVLDDLLSNSVNSTTGKPNQSIIREQDLITYNSNFSDYEEWIYPPSTWWQPRLIKLGLEVAF